jgi:cytochrome c5
VSKSCEANVNTGTKIGACVLNEIYPNGGTMKYKNYLPALILLGAFSANTYAADTGGDPGQQTYDNLCVNCHGVSALASMIPQTGDADAWSPRISKGIEVLYDHAINGFTGNMGMMPAKGGNPALSDEDVKAAVDYMVGRSGG